MILRTLTLRNFRQYHGMQRIHFSVDKTRNVTVIHGENGSGKTALLNAFLWCLYGESELPDPEDVLSERLIVESDVGDELEASVTLTFDNDLSRYTIVRSVRGKKIADGTVDYGRPVLELQYIDETGKTIKPRNAQDTIDQIIPPDLRSYFFFDGERIDNLTKTEGVKDVKHAIKILMGLEILERATSHLETVQRRFRQESAQHATPEIQRLSDEMDANDQRLEATRLEKQKLEEDLVVVRAELEAVRERLRNLEASRELQTRKDECLARESALQGELDKIRDEIRQLVSKRGAVAFCGNAIASTRVLLEDKRRKSEIPSGIKQQFVDDLLERAECICGTRLEPGTREFSNVQEWRERAGDTQLENEFITMNSQVAILTQERSHLYPNLTRLLSSREDLKLQLRSVQEELSEISVKLESKDVEEVADLTRKERDLDSDIHELNRRIGACSERLQALQHDQERLNNQLKERKRENEKAQKALERFEACERVREVVLSILDIQSEEVQRRLQQRISYVYNRMLRKDYEVVIDDDYSLSVYKRMGEERIPVRMSQGERQVTSLAFLGAVVNIAREQYDMQQGTSYFRGGYYPVVMDSPFGTMDTDHRHRTAVSIPSLAHQVIVLASSSQWAGPVEDGMRPYVGREYWLEYHIDKLGEGGTQFEYTEIREDSHAQARKTQ